MEYRYKQEDKYELPQHSHYPNQNTDTCIAKGQIQYPMVHWANGGHFNDLHANINASNISIIRKLNNLGLAVLGQASGVFPPTLGVEDIVPHLKHSQLRLCQPCLGLHEFQHLAGIVLQHSSDR